MSEIIPLQVTLELPASEMMEHGGEILVRCPLNGKWVPMTDYYSENQGSLLPLVGNASYEDAYEHWVDTGEVYQNTGDALKDGTPIMRKDPKPDAIKWDEVVRILPKVEEAPPEGGTLTFDVTDGIGTKDKFGR